MKTRKWMRWMLFAAICILVCGVSAVAQEGSPKNVPQVTAAGVTFAAPGGWSVSSGSSGISMLAPEGDAHVVVLDEKAPDAATAVAQAWQAYKPGFARPIRNSEDL